MPPLASSIPSNKPRIQSATSGFAQWLAQHQLTLFVSTYQHDCLICLSATGSDEIRLSAYPFDRPMGIAATRDSFKLATRQHLWQFENTRNILSSDQSRTDAVFRLLSVSPTGFLDTHDLVNTDEGNTVLVDTHHSCLREVTQHRRPTPIWNPSFITDLAPEDRCHLNGLATEDGTPRFATVVSQSNQAEGWRHEKRDGGALIDIESNDVLTSGLSMPHSPRLHRDKIWLLNAGTGEFGFIDPVHNAFHAIAFCPGFLRGLAFHQEFAVIGLSQARHNRKFTGLELADALDKRSQTAICGLMIVNIDTQEICETVEFSEPITELFDVQLVSGIGHPTLLKCRALD